MKSIQEYGRLRDGDNWTPAVVEALRSGIDGLVFPPGIYHFYRAGADTRFCCFSNNDSGLKSLVFNVENRKNFTIEAPGAEFIFHDRVVPFRFSNVCGLKLSGFAMDCARSPVIEGVLEECGANSAVVRFAPDCRYGILDGRIFFIDDEYKFVNPAMSTHAYDTVRGEMKAGRRGTGFSNKTEEVAPGVVRFTEAQAPGVPGDTIILKPEPRLTPGIVLDGCRGVKLEHLTLFCAGGMGVLAQNSFDLELESVCIGLRPGGKRLISVSDDGAHFANCGGGIVLRNCAFRHQWDDAVNIHGVYRDFLFRGEAMLRVGHFQQQGVPLVEPGERLLIGDRVFTVKRIHNYDQQFTGFTTVEPLGPGDPPQRASAMNLDRQPDVEISGCVFANNKPRGILVSSGGRVLLEHNTLHTPGVAVYIAGDSLFWYEAGPVRDVTIRNNVFDNCFYQGTCSGHAVIDLNPEAPGELAGYYHRNIRVRDNLFRDNHHRIFHARHTDDIEITGNRWERDETYNATSPAEPVSLEHCGRARIENNDFPVTGLQPE